MESYRDNLEIDLKDLALKILKQWKAILLATVIFGILGVGYALYSGGYLSLPVVPKSAKEASDLTLDELKDEVKQVLTAREIKDVELTYDAYLECEKLYSKIEKSSADDTTELEIELLKATQQIIAVKSYFSADQLAYYNALFEKDGEEMSPAFTKLMDKNLKTYKENAEKEEAEKNSATLEEPREFSYKKVIIAAFFGAFLVIMIVSLKYIMKPVLKTADDLRTAFKLPIISSLRSGNEGAFSYVYSSILASLKSSNAKKVFFLSATADSDVAELRHKTSEQFNAGDITAIASNSILDDPTVLDTIVDSDGVILFEKIGQSKYDDIARELEICNSLGVKVLGAVVTE